MTSIPQPLGDGRSVRLDGDPPIWTWHDEFVAFQVTPEGDHLVWSADNRRGLTWQDRQPITAYFAIGPDASDLPDLIQEDLTRWLKARHPEHAGAPDLVLRWQTEGIRASAALTGDRIVWEESEPKGGGGSFQQEPRAFFASGPGLAHTLPGTTLRIAEALKRRDPSLPDLPTPYKERPRSDPPKGRGSRGLLKIALGWLRRLF